MWLKEKRESAGSGAPIRPEAGGRRPGALLWRLGLLVLLVYGGLHVFVRTGFFRSRVEAELSRLAGMEMRAGRIRATVSLNLRIRDMISVSEVAGIEARLTRIRWRLFRPRGEPMLESIRVDGLALTLAPGPGGAIQPAFLGPLSKKIFEWAGVRVPAVGESAEHANPAGPGEVAERGGGSEAFRNDFPLVLLRGLSMRVQDAQGNVQASVSGMDLEWTSMKLSDGRRVAHVDCRAAELKVANGPRITGLHVEMVEAGGQRFLMDLDAADWGAARPPRPVGDANVELLRSME